MVLFLTTLTEINIASNRNLLFSDKSILERMNFDREITANAKKVVFKTSGDEEISFSLEDQSFMVRRVQKYSLLRYHFSFHNHFCTYIPVYERKNQQQRHGLTISDLIDSPHQFSMSSFKKPKELTDRVVLDTKVEDSLGYFCHHRIDGYTGFVFCTTCDVLYRCTEQCCYRENEVIFCGDRVVDHFYTHC